MTDPASCVFEEQGFSGKTDGLKKGGVRQSMNIKMRKEFQLLGCYLIVYDNYSKELVQI